jgi:hypothetical protein
MHEVHRVRGGLSANRALQGTPRSNPLPASGARERTVIVVTF